MFQLQIFNDSIGIRLKYAVHLGKKFLAAIFSAIVYCITAIHYYEFEHLQVSNLCLSAPSKNLDEIPLIWMKYNRFSYLC